MAHLDARLGGGKGDGRDAARDAKTLSRGSSATTTPRPTVWREICFGASDACSASSRQLAPLALSPPPRAALPTKFFASSTCEGALADPFADPFEGAAYAPSRWCWGSSTG